MARYPIDVVAEYRFEGVLNIADGALDDFFNRAAVLALWLYVRINLQESYFLEPSPPKPQSRYVPNY